MNPTIDRELYGDHVKRVAAGIDEVLRLSSASGAAYKGVVFHAGTPSLYHADDQGPHFHGVPHFRHWLGLDGPHHMLVYTPGETPRLIQVVTRDFWHEAPEPLDHPYREVLDVTEVADLDGAITAVGDVKGYAYVGDSAKTAGRLDIGMDAVEPSGLMTALDWFRAYKTRYEITCLREAARIAGKGHAAVRSGVSTRDSERSLNAAYLHHTGHQGHEVPYGNIIGWDTHGAVLHYRAKSNARPDPGAVLLIDAGASFLGYGSDITRTYVHDNVHPVFLEILDGLEKLQRELVGSTSPGTPFGDLHTMCNRGIATILKEAGIFKISAEEAFTERLVYPFFPHGLGHHLGIQVHDVGGKISAPDGSTVKPPETSPHLRSTRTLEVSHVVTIEPGIYFIPMLLESHREGERADAFDWGLIDALTPFGGMRIEDDIHVTAVGPDDLSRPFVPGHR